MSLLYGAVNGGRTSLSLGALINRWDTPRLLVLLLTVVFIPVRSSSFESSHEVDRIVDSSLRSFSGEEAHLGMGGGRKLLTADLTTQLLSSLQQVFVSSSDHSPTLPPDFMRQEAEMDKLNSGIIRGLKKSAADAEALSAKTKDLKAFIEESLQDVSQEVKNENTRLSDKINAVVAIAGPSGLAGMDGTPGLSGKAGKDGLPGLQGPPGKPGVIGASGSPGVEGLKGPVGSMGPPGQAGSGGQPGINGELGKAGPPGSTGAWAPAPFFCPDAKTDTMRLIDCSSQGCRLEVYYADEWGTVCSVGLGPKTGETVCKAFGFSSGGNAVIDLGGGKGKIWLSDVKCDGLEGDIGDCKHAAWGQNTCGHGHDLGICCFGDRADRPVGQRETPSEPARCPGIVTDDMRLVDCNVDVCRLEVKHDGLWGSVCGNGFTLTSAVTVCNLMGLSTGKFKQACATQGPFGACQENTNGEGPIWLENLVCLGFERDLEGCRHSPWGATACSHADDVGVCCSGSATDVPPPSHCRAGELDYRFNENLQSSTGGPDLSAPWGGTFDGVVGYHFTKGQGLGVDPSGCIQSNAYTVYMKIKLDTTLGARKLLHSNGWGEEGLYVTNRQLQLSQFDNATIKCEQKVLPNVEYQFVISREYTGEVRLYIDGAMCANDMSSGPTFLKLNPDQVLFLVDTGFNNPSGYVERIRMFDKALSEGAVAKICQCELPVQDKPCDLHVEINAEQTGIIFSSVRAESWTLCAAENQLCKCSGKVRFGSPDRDVWITAKVTHDVVCSDAVFNDPLPGWSKVCQCKSSTQVGSGYASAQLNSEQAWSPETNSVGEWVQMDTGTVQSVAGLVTQGRRDAGEWVTSYIIKVSSNGQDWSSIGCGRIFSGNFDSNTKVQAWFHAPVKARYVRVYPIEWQGSISMRAGILVCERPCVDGQLDYEFPMSFMSSTLGPSLVAQWGDGHFLTLTEEGKSFFAYQFDAGQGFELNPLLCLKGSAEWTILIDVSLLSVDGFKRILGSEGWGDYGLYVNQQLMIIPKDAGMECTWTVRSNKFYKFVMSRNAAGYIKLYVNGAACAQGSPDFMHHFELNPNSVTIMHDAAGEETGGYIRNVHIWNRALPDEEVENECQCRLPDSGEMCSFTTVFNPPASRTTLSSVWEDSIVGVGYGQARLGSSSAWSAKFTDTKQYLQIDTGMVQSIAGVVTQGRHDADQWVTTYSIQVSNDGTEWKDVSCGLEFNANKDRHTKVTNAFGDEPVKARFVRIIPQTWNGWISMRAGVVLCEKPCKNSELDYDFTGSLSSKTFGPALDPMWGDGDYTEKDGYWFPSGAGFGLDASRCLVDAQAWSVVIRVALDSVVGFRALITSAGWDEGDGLYVNRYLQVVPNSTELTCGSEWIEANTWYYFAMTRTADGQIALYVNGVQCGFGMEPFENAFLLDPSQISFLRDDMGQNSSGYVRNIHLWGKALDKYEVAAECGCQLAQEVSQTCPHVIEFVALPKHYRYSSVLQNSLSGTGYARGRLNSRGGWQPQANQLGEWLEIDTGSIQTLIGLVTQGSHDKPHWVNSYRVKVSNDGFEWKDVKCLQEFVGNSDMDTKQRNVFDPAVSGRYVRIYPRQWSNGIAMRAGVLLCMEPCTNGQLHFELGKQTLLSTTEGAGLRTPWGNGYFTKDGYHLLAGQGLLVDENEEGCMVDHKNVTENGSFPIESYSVSMIVKFGSMVGSIRLLASKGWEGEGLSVDGKYHLQSPVENLQCGETIRANKWYQFGLTRASDGNILLYINGGRCASGIVTEESDFTLNSDNITFLHSSSEGYSDADVKEIHVWNKVLTELEMADYSGCDLNQEASGCKRNIMLSPIYDHIKYSSVLNNDEPGAGNGRGRLDSPYAWVPAESEQQFMQMDIGGIESLAGVVTQGRKNGNDWITSYLIHVSNDELSWVPLFCGEVFDANSDADTKVVNMLRKPILARYVRLYPQTWHGQQALRAGMILCERPCISGELIYKLSASNSFLSGTNGPALIPAWGEGSFQGPTLGYQFHAGEGLSLDESSCISDTESITILIEAKLDIVTGYRKLLGSQSWGDDGLYVNGQYQAYPESEELRCSEAIAAGKFYKYMFSRDDRGYVKLYLNGYKCAGGSPAAAGGFLPDANSLEFLHSNSSWNAAGSVKNVKIWNRTLTDQEAAAQSECELALLSSRCNATIVLVPSYARLSFSSSKGNGQMGATCAGGKLDGPDGWCAGTTETGEYLQVDTGRVQTITGVVTQGRNGAHEWVSTFRVAVSTDGIRYKPVQCGSLFSGNTDMDTKVQNIFEDPVLGRFIRIIPESYYGWMSMRAGVIVCEKQCTTGQLDYQFLDDLLSTTNGPNLNTPWGFNAFDPVLGYRFYGGRGLQLNEETCFAGSGNWSILVTASIDDVASHDLRLIGSESWGSTGIFISSGHFAVISPTDKISCSEVLRPDVMYKFVVTRSEVGQVQMYLNGYPCAGGTVSSASGLAVDAQDIEFFHDNNAMNPQGYVSHIRLWNIVLSVQEIADISGCHLPKLDNISCVATFVYNIPYSLMKFSSVFNNDPVGSGYGLGRLDSPQAWSAASSDFGQYFQLDLGSEHPVKGIITQGRQDGWSQWVTQVQVTYSNDGRRWTMVQCAETFQANTDQTTKVQIEFDHIFRARFVRIWPITWHNWISMRAGILVCETPCDGGKLSYPLRETLNSITDGPSLLPQWGEGTFNSNPNGFGYRFDSGQGFVLVAAHCIDPSTYTLILDARFDQVSSPVLLMTSDNWGGSGLFVNGNSYGLKSGIQCPGIVLQDYYYKFGFSRNSNGTQIFLNGYPCGGTPDPDGKYTLTGSITFLHDAGSANSAGYAQGLRLWGQVFAIEEFASINQCVLATEVQSCSRVIVFNPPDSDVIYSSTWNDDPNGIGHGSGRLDSIQAWSASAARVGDFMQIDTGVLQNIAGIVTQMRTNYVWQYVSAFSVAVSEDGDTWSDVQCGIPFDGNHPNGWADQDVKKITMFPKPVLARYVQIIVRAFVNHPSMRAGVLVCEKPCQDGMVDFQLNNQFLSSSDGAALEPVSGIGGFSSDGYRYNSGQGLSFDESSCLKDPTTYSMVIRVKFDNTDTWNRLLFSPGWGSAGLFVQKQTYKLLPESLALICPGIIQPQTVYRLGITHSSDGEVKLYMNGWMCAAGDVTSAPNQLNLAPDNVQFFKDPENKNYYGYVSRIRAWDKVLGEVDMASVMGCTLPNIATSTCPSYVIKNVPYSRMKFDAVYGNYQAGQYYGQGRLGDTYGWLSPDYNQGHWIQMDLGQVRSVAGVVTQGMNWGWFTTSFLVKVSEDGRKWNPVECGRSFPGNTDWYSQVQNLFSAPVKARYVRIYPQTFYGYANMRAGVVACEELCDNGILDYAFDNTFESTTEGPSISTPWGLGSFSNQGYRFENGQGLRIADVSSCIGTGEAWSAILNVRLANAWWSNGPLPSQYYALMTSTGWSDSGAYVNGVYKLKPDGPSCTEQIRAQYYYQFGLTKSNDGTVTLYLNGYPCAVGTPSFASSFKLNEDISFFLGQNGQNSPGYVKEIRLFNKLLSDSEMATQSGCELLTETAACTGFVTLELDYSAVAASTTWGNTPMGQGWGSAQLNEQYAWLPWDWTVGKMWLQFDTGKIQSIAGVVTQGCGYYGYYNWYVTSFWVEVSDDGYDWTYVECGRIFDGNTDWNTQRQSLFSKPVKSRYVRILPETYNGYPALRAGVVVCESLCTDNELLYPMGVGFSSTTGGPALKAPWGQGTFQNQVYNFGAGQGLEVDEGACMTSDTEYTVLLRVLFNSVAGLQPLFRSDEWDTSGLYISTNLLLKGSSLICSNEPIRPGIWYIYGISRSKSGVINLYLNGYKCSSGSPEANGGYKLALDDMIFLRSQDGKSSSGMVTNIHAWGKTLSDNDILSETGCTLPQAASERCEHQVTLKVLYSQISASTVYAGYWIGQNSYYGQAILSSQTSWLAYNWDANQWLQFDLGSEGLVSGIVTQGSAVWYAWTTQYKVMVSSDAVSWNYVECGRIFDANADMNSMVTNLFDLPVKAQYVRILPFAWYNYVTLRAALLTCEQQCDDGSLDYQMDQEFASSTGGPSVVPTGGIGSFGSGVARSVTNHLDQKTYYSLSSHQGLSLSEKRCLKQNDTYSIVLEGWVNSLSGRQPLIKASSWGQSGLYLFDDIFTLEGLSISCPQRIRTWYFYQYGITRDSNGTIYLYLNGYPCATGIATDSNTFNIEDDGLQFFSSGNENNNGGWISSIRLWESTLTDKQMADVCSCDLPADGDACSGDIELNLPYGQITASSIWYGYSIGNGWGQVQLDSGGSWAPAAWDQNQWVQFDTGSAQMISGVVTQGNGNYWGYWPYYVTSFWVAVSNDGSTWNYVECGRIFYTYADSDYYTAYYKKVTNRFSKPVKARYVRILPENWRNGPMMRAAILVCEKECTNNELEYRMETSLASSSGGASLQATWGDGDFSTVYSDWRQSAVSGTVYNFYSSRGGLSLKQSACIKKKEAYTILMQVHLSNTDVSTSNALLTANGWSQDGLYVNGYFGLTPTNIKCSLELIQNLYYYWYGLSRSSDGAVTLYLNGYACANGTPTNYDGYSLVEDDMVFFHGKSSAQTPNGQVKNIHIWNSKLSDKDIQAIADCVLAKPSEAVCAGSLSSGLSVSSYSASSYGAYGSMIVNYYCASPQIDSQYGWCPSNANQMNWLQMDLGSLRVVSGVVTQGYMYGSYWVQTYNVDVSEDGINWAQVECGRVFIGNSDYSSKQKNYFQSPISTRYVRISPLTWYNYPFLRADVLICEEACKDGHLDYQMTSFQSSTGGPALQAPWQQGAFVPFDRDLSQDYPWWDIIFYGSMPFDECEQTCEDSDGCVLVALYKANGQGCWLKYAFGNDQGQGRRPNTNIDTIFHVDALLYKLMAPVGYRFYGGGGLQLNEGNCIKTITDYSILMDAMFDNVDNQKKLISSTGWGAGALYIVNKKLSLIPATGMTCSQNILPFYSYRIGISRTANGLVTLYLNGLPCAAGSPSGANAFQLASSDIRFFYDTSSTYQEQGWVRRIQLWDDSLSDSDMAEQSGCNFIPDKISCSQTSNFAVVAASSLDFSSTYNREDYGIGYAQGHVVPSNQFSSVAQMRAAGKTPPACTATGKTVILHRFCNGKTYFRASQGNWNQVRKVCQDNGGDIATVASDSDVAAASQVCQQYCYIGLVRNDKNSPFYWIDGSQSSYRSWDSNQPSNAPSVNVIAWYGGYWSVSDAGANRYGLCESGSYGWSNFTGKGVDGSMGLPIGDYPNIGGDGNCDDDANLCTRQNCGLMTLSDLSSLQIPNGLQVILYDDINFQGSHIRYTGPVNVDCLSVDGWNKRARSIRVLAASADDSLGGMAGFWTPKPVTNGDVWAVGDWMQIDLGTISNITSVKTAGFEGYFKLPSGSARQGSIVPWRYFNWQVTLFMMRFSNDTKDWYDVDCGRLFEAPWQNTPNAPVVNTLTAPVAARYARLYPLAWQNGIAVRMQLGVCS